MSRRPRSANRSTFSVVAASLLLSTSSAGCRMQAPVEPPPARPTPPPAPGPAQIPDPMVQIDARGQHNCAVRRSGTVLCWGKNTYGQLGNGRRDDTPRFVLVQGIRDAVQVEVGFNFSCVLRKAGSVACWGNNEDGQLGDGRGGRPGALALLPVPVAGLSGVTELSLGLYHACALTRSQQVACWGSGENGQIGSDAARAFAKPLAIERLNPVRAIASGASHVCALETRGTVQCWGRNTEGQLGDGKSGSRIKPVQVQGLTDATSIASGHNHTCVTRRNGPLACWGDNKSGQLGPSGRPKHDTPIAVVGLANVLELAGGAHHTCARVGSGRVACWGGNTHGQLGQRVSASRLTKPMGIPGMTDALDLALGESHTCILRQTGQPQCFGDGTYGAVGVQRVAMLDR